MMFTMAGEEIAALLTVAGQRALDDAVAVVASGASSPPSAANRLSYSPTRSGPSDQSLVKGAFAQSRDERTALSLSPAERKCRSFNWEELAAGAPPPPRGRSLRR